MIECRGCPRWGRLGGGATRAGMLAFTDHLSPGEVARVFAALGRAIARWRWSVLGAWLALALAGLALGGQVFDRLATVGELRPEAESQRVERRVDELLPEGPIVVAVVGDRDLYEPALVDSVTAVATRIEAIEGVHEVDHLYKGTGAIG